MKNQSKKVFRMFAMILFICILSASIFMSIKITPIAAAENIGTKFVGYSADVTDLENATKNTSRNSNSPSITVLTHGLGSNASTWSNDQQELAYNKESLIEVLAGDRTKTVVYLASYKNSTDLNFELQLLNNKDYTTKTNQEKLTQNDVSKHIILVFDDTKNSDSNSAAYAKLNFVIDKIFYDLQSLGVENPRINLIGHSRGGILNMMYANNHPYNVAGLYSIGTPYTGSTTYNLGKALLDIEPLANSLPSLSNTINSQGGRDIVDSALIDSNRTDRCNRGWCGQRRVDRSGSRKCCRHAGGAIYSSVTGADIGDSILSGFLIGFGSGAIAGAVIGGIGGANGWYKSTALQFTNNPTSSNVVLGRSSDGYNLIAHKNGATHFYSEQWSKVHSLKGVGDKGMWRINKAFLKQQIAAGKSFSLVSNPALGGYYFNKEVAFLIAKKIPFTIL